MVWKHWLKRRSSTHQSFIRSNGHVILITSCRSSCRGGWAQAQNNQWHYLKHSLPKVHDYAISSACNSYRTRKDLPMRRTSRQRIVRRRPATTNQSSRSKLRFISTPGTSSTRCRCTLLRLLLTWASLSVPVSLSREWILQSTSLRSWGPSLPIAFTPTYTWPTARRYAWSKSARPRPKSLSATLTEDLKHRF